MSKKKPAKKSQQVKQITKPYQATPKEVFVDPVPDHDPDGRKRLH